jgi:ubiquitin carboxyl-terminal hydrolase 1
MHFGHYASKNTCRVVFPDVLDLTPFTTSGKLSLSPSSPISQSPPLPPFQRSTTPTPSSYTTPRTLYRLSAVVVHYGQHSFGHYVCYRRKPRPPSYGSKRYAPPQMRCPLDCECKHCELNGPIREDNDSPSAGSQPGRGEGWLRISDDDVRECGIESVTQEGSGAFMLYYERVKAFQSDVYGNGISGAQASEETLKAPAGAKANGSTYSLAVSVIEAAAKVEEERDRDRLLSSAILSSSPPRVHEPNIVRSVSAVSALAASQRWGSKSPPAVSPLSSFDAGATLSRSLPVRSSISEGLLKANGKVEDKSTESSIAPTEPLSSSSASLSSREAAGPKPSQPIPIPMSHSSTVRRPSLSPTRFPSRSPSPQISEPIVDLELLQPELPVSPIHLQTPQHHHLAAADISMSPSRTAVDLCA